MNESAFLERGFWVPSDFETFGSYNFRSLATERHVFSGNLQAVFEAALSHDGERFDRMMEYALQTEAQTVFLSVRPKSY